jgi:hypothetical protein
MDLASINLSTASAVADALNAGAAANRTAACRKASIDMVRAPGRLIATGDLHDNPVNMMKLVRLAFDDARTPAHLTLHEIIHSPRLLNGMDFSFRALARSAALKAAFPEHVHTLLGNHELAQLVGNDIIKDGIRCIDAFNAGIDQAFGSDADTVLVAVADFIRSMPLALKCVCNHPVSGEPDSYIILCAHSLPGPAMMARFDTTILGRELSEADYSPRSGSAHMMVWGRGYDHDQLEDLVERWGVNLFILGHEKADDGFLLIPPNAVVLASDHDNGTYLPVDFERPPKPEQLPALIKRLADI